ncbi:MAG: serine hydrolase [Bryobacteraceae bacterium]|nr:serine hydrolase [Bryobacteraceae bacterium]
MLCVSVSRSTAAFALLMLAPAVWAQAGPRILLPRPERLLLWSPQERPVGFRNMEKINPVHEVKRGTSVFPLPYASKELDVSYRFEGQVMDTTTFMEQNNVAGLLVLKDGRILTERYALGFDDKSRWNSFSVAKSITSTLLGAAIKDGYIRSLDDPVTRYLPTLKKSAYDGVTIRQILNMTSGVKWNEDYSDPESDVAKCHRATDRSRGSPLVTYLARLPREAEPGTKFVYKTAETDLVGEIVIAATRKPLAEYLSEKIWAKFGMEQNAYWSIRDDKELGGCCLAVSLRDYARFALFFMNGGVAGGDHVLPSGWIQQALTATEASRAALRSRGRDGGYGFQWWVGSDGPGTYSARGIFGQSIYIDPSERLIVVIVSAWSTPLDTDRRNAARAYYKAVTEAARSAAASVSR